MTDPKERVAAISQFLEAVHLAWPLVCAELDILEADLISQLVAQESPEIRGRIKALRAIKELPETLQAERDGLNEGLAE